MDASRSPPEPDSIIIALQGQVSTEDVRWLCERVRFLLEGRVACVVCDVSAVEDPDVGTIEALARMQLAARRVGGSLQLRDPSGELRNLLAFAGLWELLVYRYSFSGGTVRGTVMVSEPGHRGVGLRAA
jgi:ABC-type transporter Mla MlaB component